MNGEEQEKFAQEVGDISNAEGIKTPEDFRQELYLRAEAGMFSKEDADEMHQVALRGEFDKLPEDLQAKAAELFSEPIEETPEEVA